ncbi:MAG: type II toxin-antitoxin system RelE/ParE family toxin [Butyricicoccaceae bacterium]
MQQQKANIVYLAPAREDILNIARYHLDQVGPKSAKQITDTILNSIDRLSYFPLLGPLHPDPVLAEKGYRKLIVKSPYVCVYRVFTDCVRIYRIINGMTDYPRLLK